MHTMAWEITGLEKNLLLLCPIHVVKLYISHLASAMIEYYNQNNLWKSLFELMVPESVMARNYGSRLQAAGSKATKTPERSQLVL